MSLETFSLSVLSVCTGRFAVFRLEALAICSHSQPVQRPVWKCYDCRLCFDAGGHCLVEFALACGRQRTLVALSLVFDEPWLSVLYEHCIRLDVVVVVGAIAFAMGHLSD